jgi:hypothetical protein
VSNQVRLRGFRMTRVIRLGLGIILLMLVTTPTALSVHSRAAGATTPTTATLDPNAGQYVPIAPTTLLNTTSGYDDPDGAGAIPADGSIDGIQVTGATDTNGNVVIPTSGVSAVFVDIQEFSSSSNGYLSAFAANVSDPDISDLSFEGGEGVNGSDIVAVSPLTSSMPGEISISNYSAEPAQVGLIAYGYFTDGTQPSAGSTYDATPLTSIVDTRVGLNSPDEQLASGTGISFNPVALGVADGVIPASDESSVSAVDLEFGALNATAAGKLQIYGESGTATGRIMSYNENQKDRLSLFLVPDPVTTDSTYNEVTVYNGGPGVLNIQALLRGYFVAPSVSDNSSSEYSSLTPTKLCDTRLTCTFVETNANDTTTTFNYGALGAGDTMCIQETGGSTGVPSSGVSYVEDEISALSASVAGWLSIAPYSAPQSGDSECSAPAASSQVVVNFGTYDGEDEDLDNNVVSPTSNSGAIAITNYASSGTVQVVVTLRGYWTQSTSPDIVQDLESTYSPSTGTAAVDWAMPGSDGGAPIQQYNVYEVNSAGSSTEVGSVPGDVYDFSFTPEAISDNVVVVAQNTNGAGAQASSVPIDPVGESSSVATSINTDSLLPSGDSLPALWSGTVQDSNGNAVAAQISATASPTSPSSDYFAPIPLASAMTDANGNFVLAAEPTSDLEAAMDSSGNIEVDLTVTTSLTSYVFAQNMYVEVASCDGATDFVATPDVSEDCISATGLDGSGNLLGGLSWVFSATDQYQDGSVLQVDSADAPLSTDVLEDSPEMGPSPIGTEAAEATAMTSFESATGNDDPIDSMPIEPNLCSGTSCYTATTTPNSTVPCSGPGGLACSVSTVDFGSLNEDFPSGESNTGESNDFITSSGGGGSTAPYQACALTGVTKQWESGKGKTPAVPLSQEWFPYSTVKRNVLPYVPKYVPVEVIGTYFEKSGQWSLDLTPTYADRTSTSTQTAVPTDLAGFYYNSNSSGTTASSSTTWSASLSLKATSQNYMSGFFDYETPTLKESICFPDAADLLSLDDTEITEFDNKYDPGVESQYVTNWEVLRAACEAWATATGASSSKETTCFTDLDESRYPAYEWIDKNEPAMEGQAESGYSWTPLFGWTLKYGGPTEDIVNTPGIGGVPPITWNWPTNKETNAAVAEVGGFQAVPGVPEKLTFTSGQYTESSNVGFFGINLTAGAYGVSFPIEWGQSSQTTEYSTNSSGYSIQVEDTNTTGQDEDICPLDSPKQTQSDECLNPSTYTTFLPNISNDDGDFVFASVANSATNQ